MSGGTSGPRTACLGGQPVLGQRVWGDSRSSDNVMHISTVGKELTLVTDLDVGPDFSIHILPIESALNFFNCLITVKMSSWSKIM